MDSEEQSVRDDSQSEVNENWQPSSPGRVGDGKSSSMSRTTGTKEKPKKKRKSKNEEFDNRLKVMENSLGKVVEFMSAFTGNSASSSNKTKPSTITDTDQSRESLRDLPFTGSDKDNGPSGVRKPLIPLEPNLDQDLGSPNISRNTDFDIRSEISLHVDRNERQEFDDVSVRSGTDNSDIGSSVSNTCPRQVKDHVGSSHTEKHSRFSKLLQKPSVSFDDRIEKVDKVKPKSIETSSKVSDKLNILSNLFKDEIATDANSTSVGLVIDEAQEKILDNSLKSKNPDRISCFKEEYKSVFPVQDSAEDYLKVPSLDDLLEPLMRSAHGSKSVATWDNHRQLFSQPYKQIERLGYQGQVASRMNIVAELYMQQALGTLINTLENEDCEKSDICQTVRDLFAISTKSLDQAGRCSAFFQLIRRRAAAQDSGLHKLKDVYSKAQSLPLDNTGVFGNELETLLEKRKERKQQLNDLLPELNTNAGNRKRKSDFVPKDNNSKVSKFTIPKVDQSQFPRNNGYNSSNNTGKSNNWKQGKSNKFDKTAAGRDAGKKENTGRSSWGSFRGPKKNDS